MAVLQIKSECGVVPAGYRWLLKLSRGRGDGPVAKVPAVCSVAAIRHLEQKQRGGGRSLFWLTVPLIGGNWGRFASRSLKVGLMVLLRIITSE